MFFQNTISDGIFGSLLFRDSFSRLLLYLCRVRHNLFSVYKVNATII